jgi:hypothetical protein
MRTVQIGFIYDSMLRDKAINGIIKRNTNIKRRGKAMLGTYRHKTQVYITNIRKISLEEIDNNIARKCGFYDAQTFKEVLKLIFEDRKESSLYYLLEFDYRED